VKAQVKRASDVRACREEKELLRVRVHVAPSPDDPLYGCYRCRIQTFRLELGFSSADLEQAVRAYSAALKAHCANLASQGYTELCKMPSALAEPTVVHKGPGPSLIPVTETEWTPALVSLTAATLEGWEIADA